MLGSHQNLSATAAKDKNIVKEPETVLSPRTTVVQEDEIKGNQAIPTNGGFITIKVEKAESFDQLAWLYRLCDHFLHFYITPTSSNVWNSTLIMQKYILKSVATIFSLFNRESCIEW